MAKQVLGRHGIPQARYRAFREHELTPASRCGSPRSSGCRVRQAGEHGVVGRRHEGARRRGAPRRDRVRAHLRRVGRRRGSRRRPRDRGRRARQPRARGLASPARSSPATSSTTTRTSTSRRRAAARPGAALTGPRRTRCARWRSGVHGAALRGPGPGRLLLRGGRPRLPLQRGQHDARLHADLDVPEAVACTPA